MQILQGRLRRPIVSSLPSGRPSNLLLHQKFRKLPVMTSRRGPAQKRPVQLTLFRPELPHGLPSGSCRLPIGSDPFRFTPGRVTWLRPPSNRQSPSDLHHQHRLETLRLVRPPPPHLGEFLPLRTGPLGRHSGLLITNHPLPLLWSLLIQDCHHLSSSDNEKFKTNQEEISSIFSCHHRMIIIFFKSG
jgi:hypothetical protein